MRSRAPRGTLAFLVYAQRKSNEFTIEVTTWQLSYFIFFIILALAGSSYYGWRSAKMQNRQETQEQKRLRSILLFVNVPPFAGF